MGFGIRNRTRRILAFGEEIFYKKGCPPWSKVGDSTRFGKIRGKWFESDFVFSAKDLENAERIAGNTFRVFDRELVFLNGKIRWDCDTVSEYQWPRKYYKRLLPVIGHSDPKIPWELSRFQHLPALVKGFLSTGQNRFAEAAKMQIEDWIQDNPCPYGINWTCAMEVAIRACNWIWAVVAFENAACWANEFERRLLESIWQHGWFIENNLEDKAGVRTNHYLADIVGLLFIGIMFPEFESAYRWRDLGVEEMDCCMNEMVYSDGVSFENSTAYHRLVLEMFCFSGLLCLRNGIELSRAFWTRLEKMFEFVMHLTRPDGRMPMIGDSDDGRLFVLSDYYKWDRWDYGYLLAIGAILFGRSDFKQVAGRFYEEASCVFGKRGREVYELL